VYYVKVVTRSSGGSAKGTPRRAVDYITDGHDARRDPAYVDDLARRSLIQLRGRPALQSPERGPRRRRSGRGWLDVLPVSNPGAAS
jgi:hypothetical protein